MALDATHDPALRSWVDSANDPGTDFPVQNLPYGRFRRRPAHAGPQAGASGAEPWRIGVAIGDQVLDLKLARERCPWTPGVDELLAPLAAGDLNAFMALGAAAWRRVRGALSAALADGSDQRPLLDPCLVPQAQVELTLPFRTTDYTDFYTGIHHATAVGRLFRPDNPLLPNYKWVPIGYHGRASSLIPSGQPFVRPRGQLKGDGEAPAYAPARRLDYELELGAVVGRANALGEAVPMAQAEDHLFGVVLLNDWSARDVQAWEYQPLGPFLSKNFATTLSPWVVTMDALEPYRVGFERPAGDPPPLPYLDSDANRGRGAIDIALEVWIETAAMREQRLAPERLSQSNFRDAYWTLAQLLVHHTSNGCNMQPGDLLGTGTQSGPGPGQGGSLLELSAGGRQPVALAGGETRTFLEDGDAVILRARCAREGAAGIGFGDCVATVLPAR
jgi:fumarylacetoacetase